MPTGLRTPEQIIDAMAQRRGLVTPVPAYFPLGVSFTAACVREAYRDVIDLLADAAQTRGNVPEVIDTLRWLGEQLATKVTEE